MEEGGRWRCISAAPVPEALRWDLIPERHLGLTSARTTARWATATAAVLLALVMLPAGGTTAAPLHSNVTGGPASSTPPAVSVAESGAPLSSGPAHPTSPAPAQTPSLLSSATQPGRLSLLGQAVPVRAARTQGPAPSGDPVTSAQAEAALSSAGSAYDGLAWEAAILAGFANTTPLRLPVATLLVNCSVTWNVNPQSNLYIPATPLSAPPGTSNAYFAYLASASLPNEFLFADVINGTAQVLFVVSNGPTCYLTDDDLAPIPPDVLDSPEVVDLGNDSGGAPFLERFESITREWEVGDLNGEPYWVLEYLSGCGSLYVDELDAYSGGMVVPVYEGPCIYQLTFAETGLPAGTLWTVTMGQLTSDTTSAQLPFSKTNGSYDFVAGAPGFAASQNGSGTAIVAGAGTEVVVHFEPLPGYYAVTFAAEGLPVGYWWYLGVSAENGTLWFVETNGTSVVVDLANGIYTFWAYAAGYSFGPDTGPVTVAGAPLVQPVPFESEQGILVTFDQTGLPASGLWVVGLRNTSFTFTWGPYAWFYLAPGRYSFSVATYAGGFVPSPSRGTLTVRSAPITVDIVFHLRSDYRAVTFTESGLPTGAAFNVSLVAANATVESGTAGSTIAYAPLGTFEFRVDPVFGYVATPSSGVVRVRGTGLSVAISFAPAAMYTVVFAESGIASETGWTVELAGMTDSATGPAVSEMAFPVGNGSHPFTVSVEQFYRPVPASGAVEVSGANVSVPVAFRPLPPTYPVVFEQTGTFVYSGWSLRLNGTPALGSSLFSAADLPNGTYPYLLSPGRGQQVEGIPPAGNVTVDGAGIEIAFSLVRAPNYGIGFQEAGLPHGLRWCVDLQGWSECSTSGHLRYPRLSPGTYEYSVLPVPGQTLTVRADGTVLPSSGTITITDASRSIHLRFDHPYSVVFTESGLPPGTNWSVRVDGVSYYSTGATLSVELPNGTYAYHLDAVPGYRATGSPSRIVVDGAGTSVTVDYLARA